MCHLDACKRHTTMNLTHLIMLSRLNQLHGFIIKCFRPLTIGKENRLNWGSTYHPKAVLRIKVYILFTGRVYNVVCRHSNVAAIDIYDLTRLVGVNKIYSMKS